MTFLTLFVIIPVVMLLCLWLAKNDSQVRIVMAVGSTALLALAIYLVFAFVGARDAGDTSTPTASTSAVYSGESKLTCTWLWAARL